MKKVKTTSSNQKDYRYFPIEYPTNIFAIAFTDAIEGYHPERYAPYDCTIYELDKSKFILYPYGDYYVSIISIGL